MTHKVHTTLTSLLTAINAGEVDLSKCSPLMIDNDSATMYIQGEDPDGFEDVKIFHAHPRDLLGEALNFWEIPHDDV